MGASMTPEQATELALVALQGEGEEKAPPTSNEKAAPNKPRADGVAKAERQRLMLRALFGEDCPLGSDSPADRDDPRAISRWVQGLWASRRDSVRKHIHLIQRNRMMRAGNQWLSSRNGSPWTDPGRQREQARVVWNLVAPALDQRMQILTDQRPGFSIQPATQDPGDKKAAAARQIACEFQYEQMRMPEKMREAVYWAQTDGVAFLHGFWNTDLGPWDERMGEDGATAPLGDCDCRVLRVEQVRVSPEATSNIPPSWVVIRDVISRVEAVARYGYTGLQGAGGVDMNGNQPQATYQGNDGEFNEDWVLSQTVPGIGDQMRNTQVVERFTLYLAKQPDILPNGLELIVIGDEVVFGPTDLMFGSIPIVRVSDGSSDPSYFPRPVMEQWIDQQMRINALLTKWVENIRVNAGGRFFTRPNTVTTETFLGGVTSMIEVKGAGALGDSIQPFQGFSVGNDVKEALVMEKQAFEDISGYNAVSRGQVTGESGRAIIASREQLERVFAPPVQALANAYTYWCRMVLSMMAWGYDIPRDLGVTGRSRPDLAKAITGSDLDGAMDVKVEPATMMPMPLSFRLYMLDNWLASGVIDMKEYRRRQMFAVTRDIGTPDEDQEARARRVSDAILNGQPVPEMRWQDDESIHQDVLERDILLQDDLDPAIIEMANARWFELANQATRKQMQQMQMQMGLPPEAGAASDGGASDAANAGAIPQGQVPLASNNPPVGSNQMVTQSLSGTPDAEQAARMLETTTVS
jgi:hypothetical protein